MFIKQTEISTPDNFTICGVLESRDENNDKLVIFSHGFLGDMEHHLIYNAASFLHQHNIATFSFDYYSNQRNTRPFLKSTFTSHVNDLKTLIDKFSEEYKHIYLVGHSLGALVVLAANCENVRAIILWDPVNDMGGIFKGLEFIPDLNAFIFKNRTNTLIPKDMVDDFSKQRTFSDLIANTSLPTKIILADNKYSEATARLLNENYPNHILETVIVSRADHSFNNRDAELKLFEETLVWVEKY